MLMHTVLSEFYPLQWRGEWPDQDVCCKLIFIGRDLETKQLQERFQPLWV